MADAANINAWDDMANRNPVVRFIDECLRGAGQVIFQNNPLTGIFFLAAIWWGSIVAGQVAVAVGATIALIIATFTAVLLDVDEPSLRQGLFGFNGILVGAAVPSFIAPGWTMWILLIIGAAVSTVVMLAISNIMKTWGVAALTFPFVLTTWFLMLSAYAFHRIPIAGLSAPALPHAANVTDLHATLGNYLEYLFKGPAQVFLINNAISGLLVVIGLFINSRAAAIFALVGSAVGIIIALIFGGSPSAIANGLYGFSPVLTAVALGCVFYAPSWRVTLYALLGTIFTVIVQAALDTAMTPIGIPTFTAPFVFATWLFLLPKAKLKPHPHEEIKNGLFTKHPVAQDLPPT
ncbi:urea transporter [Hyphomicrobium sp. ghe19]|uniref:urea transporter n=1 Tax=Hyphomicrobium sp. ghe19 TaxID=2682968 RepID=UPI001366995E|nr:Urea transporter [Hyphomicrobium sp. ghe19]